MQIGAINNQNFKGGYTLTNTDTKNTHQFISAIRDVEDSFELNSTKKKTTLEKIGSVLTCVALSGIAGIYAYKKGGQVLNSIKNSKIATNLVNNEKIKNLISDTTQKVGTVTESLKSKALSKVPENIANIASKAKGIVSQAIANISDKVDAPILAGIATSAVATPYFATRDNNGDGVADMMQKGVSAYEGIADKFSKFEALVDVIS